jgi:hypothetical protein
MAARDSVLLIGVVDGDSDASSAVIVLSVGAPLAGVSTVNEEMFVAGKIILSRHFESHVVKQVPMELLRRFDVPGRDISLARREGGEDFILVIAMPSIGRLRTEIGGRQASDCRCSRDSAGDCSQRRRPR